MKYEFIFWINDLNLHLSSWIESCSDSRKVLIVASKSFNEGRKKDGWHIPDFGKSDIKISLSKPEIYSIIDTNLDSINLFLGINAFPLVHTAFIYSKKRGVKIGVFLESGMNFGFRRYFRKLKSHVNFLLYNRYIDFMLPMGYLGVKWFQESGFSNEKLFPFLYVTETPDYKSFVKGINEESIVNIIIVAQCIKRKNIDIVLNALANLKDLKWQLKVVGEGNRKPQLMELTKALSLDDRVEFVGSKSNKQICQLFFNSDFSILPSLWDGWGAVVNESLMAGTPVICSNMCGASCLISNIRGEIFDVNSIVDLTQKLKRRVLMGKLTIDDRDVISTWSKKISAESVNKYVLDVVDHIYNSSSNRRPNELWM